MVSLQSTVVEWSGPSGGDWWPHVFTWNLLKNCLNRPKIKQGTTSKVNCILFNRLLSPVLLNKSSLARAKAVNFNSNFLNKCFSNYYQVQTWPVFTEMVTYDRFIHQGVIPSEYRFILTAIIRVISAKPPQGSHPTWLWLKYSIKLHIH